MWQLKVVGSARRELKQLSKNLKREARQIIRELAEDPFPPATERLRGFEDYYRIPFGNYRYRILYRVIEHNRLVLVTRVRSRADAYRGL